MCKDFLDVFEFVQCETCENILKPSLRGSDWKFDVQVYSEQSFVTAVIMKSHFVAHCGSSVRICTPKFVVMISNGRGPLKKLSVLSVRRYVLSETVRIWSNLFLPVSVYPQYSCHSEISLDLRTLLMNDWNTWWSFSKSVCLVACFPSSTVHTLSNVPLFAETWLRCVL